MKYACKSLIFMQSVSRTISNLALILMLHELITQNTSLHTSFFHSNPINCIFSNCFGLFRQTNEPFRFSFDIW